MAMGKRALVTGVAGFIGSHLGEALVDAGWDVVGLDSFTASYDPARKEANLQELSKQKGFRLLREDLNRTDLEELLGGVDVVFHQAAEAGVRTSWGHDFDRYVTANILATQKLLEAARTRALRRFVFASSSSVYGEVADLPAGEKTPKNPRSPYGVTKLAAENLGHLYRENFGVPFVALRYFTVFGPRQRPDMAMFRLADAVLTGKKVTLFGSGEQTRDFTFVSDVVQANLLAAGREKPGAVYNIGGGARVPLFEVIETVEEISGRKISPVRGEWEKGDVRDTWADCRAAAEELGYSPQVGLREGLERMIDWQRRIG